MLYIFVFAFLLLVRCCFFVSSSFPLFFYIFFILQYCTLKAILSYDFSSHFEPKISHPPTWSHMHVPALHPSLWYTHAHTLWTHCQLLFNMHPTNCQPQVLIAVQLKSKKLSPAIIEMRHDWLQIHFFLARIKYTDLYI